MKILLLGLIIAALLFGAPWEITLALAIIFVLLLCKKFIWHGSRDKTPKVEEDELPEENLPEVDPSTIFSDDGISILNAIAYFAQIQKKYSILKKIWLPIREQLIRIKRHVNDKTLYLGVIGEASAGKSTFINALLGFEFLKEDTSLGTTVASTILRYGENVGITVNYLKNRKKEFFDAKALGISRRDKLNKWAPKVLSTIQKYTTNEEIASAVYSVDVTLPVENALLKSGVAIVDTPGINSGNEQHNDITTRAIREICDTALILVPANVPLSACLSQYIKENLLDVLGRCVLLMTQADKLRSEKERKMQLKYIASRLKSAVGGEVAASFSASAYYVLNRDDYGKADKDAVKHYRDEFAQMADSLKKIIVGCRSSAILEKILLCLNGSLLPLLSDMIEKKKEEYTQRKKALEENKLTDIDSFIQDGFAECKEKILEVTVTQQDIMTELEKIRKSFLDAMYDRIYGATSRSELKDAMSESLIRSKISDLQTPLKEALNTLCLPYQNALTAAMESFHKEFTDAYKKLENISKQKWASSMDGLDEKSMDVSVSIADFGSKVNTQMGADVMKSVGGAGAGAVIGSFICPGLGTIIGGVLGGILGALFGKSLDTLKEEAYDSVCNIGNDWSAQMIPQANKYVDSFKESVTQKLKEGIEAYKEQYGKKIAAIIRKEKNEQNELQMKTKIADDDFELFKKIHPKIEQMIQALRNSTQQSTVEAVA